MDDIELMRVRADSLFTYDARGRMLRTNEPHGLPAARMFVARTPTSQIVRIGANVPDLLARDLTKAVDRQRGEGALEVPPSAREEVRKLLELHAPVSREGGGPAYRFPVSIARASVLLPSNFSVVEVTDENVDVLRGSFAWLRQDIAGRRPCFAVVHDGAALSVCFSSRIGLHVAEAGLETLPSFRRRGYAAAVTAAWGLAVGKIGRAPLYSSSWANGPSQGVALRLRLIRFGADTWWL